MNLDDICMSVRLRMALKAAGFNTTDDLLGLDARSIRLIRSIGRKSEMELLELRERGVIKLSDDIMTESKSQSARKDLRYVKALSYYCGMIPKWEHPQPGNVFVTEDREDLIFEYDKQGNVCRTFNKVYLLEIRYAQDNGNK